MDLPRLIVLDLDGTLLPESKQISSRSLRVLERLQEAGAKVTLATGKFLHLSSIYADQLRIEAPLIALDGARISQRGHLSVRGIERRIAIEALEEMTRPPASARLCERRRRPVESKVTSSSRLVSR